MVGIGRSSGSPSVQGAVRIVRALVPVWVAAVGLTFLLGVPARAGVAESPLVLYVAPEGDDRWTGTLPEPNAAGTDGPLATLEAARDRIRQRKRQKGLPRGGVRVEIRPGRHQREATWKLTAEDSGTAASPIVYQGTPGAEIRLSGGRVVRGFRPVKDPAVLKRLDPAARGHVIQADLRGQGITDLGRVNSDRLELFFRDKPMTLARWPNEGFTRIADLVGNKPINVRGTKGDRVGKFVYEGDRPSRWVHEPEAWVHGYWFWDWSDQRHRVASIDLEQRTISVAPPYHHYGYRKGQWYYAFNLLAELDRPGEWYVHRESGLLYFWPPVPVEKGDVVVSLAGDLVLLEDVSHVRLEGLILEAGRGTGVIIRGGSHSSVVNCVVRNLGSWGVRVEGGTGHRVEGCHLYGLGDGGIALSGGDRRRLEPAGHEAVDNDIHHYARWNRMYRPGIALHGVSQRAAHNRIHHAPHQAIGFSGNDHLIELNEIDHVCLESNDAGAIYAGRDWTMRGTVIRHNFMHHVTGFRDRGCVGVYLDDMFCGTTIYGNVFYRVTRAAFIGGGRDCRVENNIFVDCNPALHIDSRAMGWASYHVKTTMKQRLDAMPIRSEPWATRYPELLTLWEDEPAAPKGNVVARNVCWGGRWDEVDGRARPLVTFQDNLVGVDPRFVDAQKMDFRLREDSPVYSQVPGFQPLPFEQMGLRRQRTRREE